MGDNDVEEASSLGNEPRVEGMGMSLRSENDGNMGMKRFIIQLGKDWPRPWVGINLGF